MFQKRGNKKAINLQAEIEELKMAQAGDLLSAKNVKNQNVFGLPASKQQSIQKQCKNEHDEEQFQSIHPFAVTKQNKNQVEADDIKDYDIEQCFAQVRKLRQLQENAINSDTNDGVADKIQIASDKLHSDQNQVDEVKMIDENQKNQASVFKGKEDDIQILEIEEDFEGGFSPDQDSNDIDDEDFEDQIIRKTLTKSNFQRISKNNISNLTHLKVDLAKDKLIKTIENINQLKIKRHICRDIDQKKRKLNQIQHQLTYLNQRQREKEDKLAQKKKKLTQLQEQFQKYNKVIEFIFYHGDQIKDFNVESIYQQCVGSSQIQMEEEF